MEPVFAQRSIIDHTEYLPKVHVVVSEATDVTDRQVITADGEHFAYDYLVLATGYSEGISRTRAERINYYEKGEHTKSSH